MSQSRSDDESISSLGCFDATSGDEGCDEGRSVVDRIYDMFFGEYREVPQPSSDATRSSSSPYGLTYDQATRPVDFGPEEETAAGVEEVVDVDVEVGFPEEEVELEAPEEVVTLPAGDAVPEEERPGPEPDKSHEGPRAGGPEDALTPVPSPVARVDAQEQIQAYLDTQTPGKFDDLGDTQPVALELAYPLP